VTCFNRKPD